MLTSSKLMTAYVVLLVSLGVTLPSTPAAAAPTVPVTQLNLQHIYPWWRNPVPAVRHEVKHLFRGEAAFVRFFARRFNYVAKDNLQLIWHTARSLDVSPWLSAAIAWKESTFHPDETSPPTNYGFSRGEYMVLTSTAATMGVSDPSLLYNPQVSVNLGNRYLRYLTNLLGGRQRYGPYAGFSTQDVGGVTRVLYNGVLLRDQNGQAVPLSLLVAMGYDGGPTSILDAVEGAVGWQGTLVIDPRSSACPFSYQQLDYVRKIAAEGLYNFQGYHFSYSVDDVPQNQLLS